MEYLIKPLTKKMLAHLKKARAIELSQRERNFCKTDDFKGTFPGLYNRGLIDTKKVFVDSKETFCVYITKSGVNFLNQYNDDRKKLEINFNPSLNKHLLYQLFHTIKFW